MSRVTRENAAKELGVNPSRISQMAHADGVAKHERMMVDDTPRRVMTVPANWLRKQIASRARARRLAISSSKS